MTPPKPAQPSLAARPNGRFAMDGAIPRSSLNIPMPAGAKPPAAPTAAKPPASPRK
jgi:hypothetical protein